MQFDYCIVLTYYSPYVSGLTNVARDIAEGLARSGKKVCVVTSQFDKALLVTEMVNGVCVLRAPVLFSLGKGVISPALISLARRISKCSRVLNIHAPMLEAGLIAWLSSAPVVITYQCDVSLPPTLLGQLQHYVIDWSMHIAIRFSKLVTVSSADYAQHSRLSHALQKKQTVIPPTCRLRKKGAPIFREGNGLHVGFLGRIVEEKGLEYLIDGFSMLHDPHARLLIAGDFAGVAGGSIINRIKAKITADSRIRLLGFLPEDRIADFYASLDIFSLPSINPFEAFGIVQVEAMMVGIPVIATNLPGVRQPVMMTKMGEIVEPCSARQITESLVRLARIRPDCAQGAALAQEMYSLDSVIAKFEQTFELANGSN